MDLQLRRLRKEAGYKSRRAFADALGVPGRQITAWESGERRLRLEDACDIADLLHCSIDELAGHHHAPDDFSDPRQAELNRCYGACAERQRLFILESARCAVCASREAADGGAGDGVRPRPATTDVAARRLS